MTPVKLCTRCKEIKPHVDFFKRRCSPIGLSSHCKTCKKKNAESKKEQLRKYGIEYRLKNREKIKEQQRNIHIRERDVRKVKSAEYRYLNREKIRKRDSESVLTFSARARKMFNSAKESSARRNLVFSICYEQVLEELSKGRCAQSDIPFDMRPSPHRVNPFGPSLDRIDNSKGYEPDNIQVVCNMFNIGKGEAALTDFVAMCVAVGRKYSRDLNVNIRLMEILT